MRIRQTQVFLALVTTVFCTVAFSSTGADQAGDPAWFNVIGGSESVTQQPLLLAENESNEVEVEVCKVTKETGRMDTKTMTMEEFNVKVEQSPHEYILGPCNGTGEPS